MRAFLILVFLILLTVSLPASDVWPQAQKSARAMSERIDRLIRRVEAIEKRQQEILQNFDKTIEEIKNLKIQTRR